MAEVDADTVVNPRLEEDGFGFVVAHMQALLAAAPDEPETVVGASTLARVLQLTDDERERRDELVARVVEKLGLHAEVQEFEELHERYRSRVKRDLAIPARGQEST